jgi:predicted AAA+ superfamily ATPase
LTVSTLKNRWWPSIFQGTLADRPRTPARFLVLGSASPELLRQGSESLAGRVYYYELPGFSLEEVGANNVQNLWLRGGFPRAYLERTLRESDQWRLGFIRTFLERDLPQLGIRIDARALRRFWNMLAHYHGQVWNAAEFSRSFGVSDTTVRRYLDTLTSALVVRQLPPWHANVKKRQIKSPKVYLSDSGVLHSLLGLKTRRDLEGHPKVGASWEVFALEQTIQHLGARTDECYFWGSHGGGEIDLLVVRGNKRIGFEFKRSSAPRLTRSMRTAIADLGLSALTVVHAGEKSFPIAPKIRAVPLQRLVAEIKPLR